MNMIMKTGRSVDVNFTCLQGYVDASFDKLRQVFGEPWFGSGDGKIDVEWAVEFDNGTIARIYNWKDYDGGHRCREAQSYNWHIGGHDEVAVRHVQDLLEVKR